MVGMMVRSNGFHENGRDIVELLGRADSVVAQHLEGDRHDPLKFKQVGNVINKGNSRCG